MTYNLPFLYRCQYDDGQAVEFQTVFGEAAMEQFYTRCMKEAAELPGASVYVDFYDRKYKKWKPLVKYHNKGGVHNAP